MGYESSLSKPPEYTEDIKINEIAYVWSEEKRNQRYKELIGELPKRALSEEQIAYGILHPEEEKERVFRENREEDREHLDYFPKKSP